VIAAVLRSPHFGSGAELGATQHRYGLLCNQQIPQSALGSRTPLQVMTDWRKMRL